MATPVRVARTLRIESATTGLRDCRHRTYLHPRGSSARPSALRRSPRCRPGEPGRSGWRSRRGGVLWWRGTPRRCRPRARARAEVGDVEDDGADDAVQAQPAMDGPAVVACGAEAGGAVRDLRVLVSVEEVGSGGGRRASRCPCLWRPPGQPPPRRIARCRGRPRRPGENDLPELRRATRGDECR